MTLYNSFCCDNFFKEPNKILDFSKTLSFEKSNYGNGYRTENLHNLDKSLFNYINLKIINNIYPSIGNVEFNASTHFEKNIIDICDGWVHQDSNLITAIVYLNKEGTYGTSIYQKKKEYDEIDQTDKKKYFLKPNKKDKNYILLKKQENNLKFQKTISFSGVYNRLVCFNALTPHAADVNVDFKERLILISFINFIKINVFPNSEIII